MRPVVYIGQCVLIAEGATGYAGICSCLCARAGACEAPLAVFNRPPSGAVRLGSQAEITSATGSGVHMFRGNAAPRAGSAGRLCKLAS